MRDNPYQFSSIPVAFSFIPVIFLAKTKYVFPAKAGRTYLDRLSCALTIKTVYLSSQETDLKNRDLYDLCPPAGRGTDQILDTIFYGNKKKKPREWKKMWMV